MPFLSQSISHFSSHYRSDFATSSIDFFHFFPDLVKFNFAKSGKFCISSNIFQVCSAMMLSNLGTAQSFLRTILICLDIRKAFTLTLIFSSFYANVFWSTLRRPHALEDFFFFPRGYWEHKLFPAFY